MVSLILAATIESTHSNNMHYQEALARCCHWSRKSNIFLASTDPGDEDGPYRTFGGSQIRLANFAETDFSTRRSILGFAINRNADLPVVHNAYDSYLFYAFVICICEATLWVETKKAR